MILFKDNPDKKAKTLNQSWGGFGSGQKVIDLMFEQVDRLESVGVKVWWIGHVKTKEVKNIYNDETYQILTSDQQQNYFNALKKNLHFLCLAYFDRELQKEKTGKKNIVTKKEEVKTTIKDETRKIKFRDDSFVVDSGSRFSDIVPEINLDADEFITAITDAIKAEINKNGVSVEDRKKENDKEDAETLKRIAEAEKAARVEKELNEIKTGIVEFFNNNKTNLDVLFQLVTNSLIIEPIGKGRFCINDISNLACKTLTLIVDNDTIYLLVFSVFEVVLVS